MNAITYAVGYKMLSTLNVVGHRVPKRVLRWWILRTPTEIECLRELRAGRIDVDQFDFRVDRNVVLTRAYNRVAYRMAKGLR